MKSCWALLLLVLACAAGARAAVPAPFSAGQLPNITVWDEHDQRHSLWDALGSAGSGPVVVLPIYARCTMSCPVLTRMLVQQTQRLGSGAPYRVLIFSFDSGDAAAALRNFRAEKGLPASWLLVRSNAVDIRRFCDFFHYPVMSEGPVMIHSNTMFLLDSTFRWRATFVDQNWDAADLKKWLHRAESTSLIGRLITTPDAMILAGFGGVLASLLLVLGVLVFARERKQTGR